MGLTSLLVLLVTAAVAGPVGRYLGFEVHRQGDAIGAVRDSIHYLLPNPGDTVIALNRVDTTTIVAETVRLGDPAWVIKLATNPTSGAKPERRNEEVESPKSDFAISTFPFLLRPRPLVPGPRPLASATDTSYESGETLLCSRQTLGDSVRWLNAYRVPFSIGTTWRFGLAGTYLGDFTGDSIIDTLKVWADTCTVLDTEDVVVPYGAVPHCFKIRRSMYQRLAAEQSGVPVIESSYIRTFEWYKDSLWSIKESTQASGPIYMKIIIWLHAADFVSTDVSKLNGLGYLGIAAHPYTVHRAPLTVSPNPFRSRLSVTCKLQTANWSLRVYDTDGRLVLSQPVRTSSFILHHSSLPAGAYFIRAGTEVCPVTKLK